MRFLKCCAGLALYALLFASCETPASTCEPVGSAAGSESCQSIQCTGSMADCKNGAADGCETDTAVDINNCGGCGTKCPVPANGEASCTDGVCGVSTCGSRFKDCNTSATDGCEVDTFRDANNCGTCGNVCPGGANAVGVCIVGKCQLACQAAYLDCNKDSTDGCETNGASDLANCGNCGNTCTAVGATTPACSAGSCITTMCTSTYRTCKAGPIDSCETDTATNAANCGACGKQCAAVPNATPGCAASNCGIGSCNANFSDCDKIIATGCEVNTTSDAKNCSACGKACLFANATPTCVTSACVMGACNSGYADCDVNPATGCEINTANDIKNCGKCGMACPAGKSCLSGVCSTCGNGTVEPGEERDPAPGPFTSAVVDGGTCKWHFENVRQLYCNGGCSWAGGSSCDQADADILCKLRTGNPLSTATAYVNATAQPFPGFSCPGLGTNIGTLPLRGVGVSVYYQDSSILANHGAGVIILDPTCTNP